MPFLVLSFAFGGSSQVSLHACVSEPVAAGKMYRVTHGKYDEYNRKHAKSNCQTIVELVYVADDTECSSGLPIFFSNEKFRSLYRPTDGRWPHSFAVVASNNGAYDSSFVIL